MEYKKLGSSDLEVSKICLGTMMMGSQTDTAVSKHIISEADHAGINFIDTAEMYSIPPEAKTQGNSERIIGEWLKERGGRDNVYIATKVTGRSDMTWIRGGFYSEVTLSADNINHAIEHSLNRLQTDYVDLYQVHWPDRQLPMFGFDMEESALDDPHYVPIEETLRALEKLVKDGKVRYIGVSNENLNGVQEYVRLAKEAGLPMIASIQNAYSLVNRQFEDELSDYCMENNIGLLPYSILGMGYLTGKYMQGNLPEGSRKILFRNTDRYAALDDDVILNKYLEIAVDAGITLNQLAHAFCYGQAFIDSTIIAATTTQQLQDNIKAWEVKLSDDTRARIDEVHAQHPNPCP